MHSLSKNSNCTSFGDNNTKLQQNCKNVAQDKTYETHTNHFCHIHFTVVSNSTKNPYEDLTTRSNWGQLKSQLRGVKKFHFR